MAFYLAIKITIPRHIHHPHLPLILNIRYQQQRISSLRFHNQYIYTNQYIVVRLLHKSTDLNIFSSFSCSLTQYLTLQCLFLYIYTYNVYTIHVIIYVYVYMYIHVYVYLYMFYVNFMFLVVSTHLFYLLYIYIYIYFYQKPRNWLVIKGRLDSLTLYPKKV